VFKRCISFPIADVDLHNALKVQLGLDRKPQIDEIEELSLKWKGWEAYATFYLWRSLADTALHPSARIKYMRVESIHRKKGNPDIMEFPLF
jgi:3-methyladenine DNA glycosylase/8-oxoguanine DNA glycosylase